MRVSRSSGFLVLAATSLLLAVAPTVPAQSIRGRLLDQESERPLPGVPVSLVTEPDAQPVASTKSGGDGEFTLIAPAPGIYRLRAELAGDRRPVSPAMDLPSGLVVSFTWRLPSTAQRLAPIVVVESNRRPAGQQGDFYERIRRRAAFGHLITRQQIEQRHPFRVTDLLRMTPGLRIVPSVSAFGDLVRTSEGCSPLVYLDGIRFPLYGESIDAIVHPNDLEAIEIYAHGVSVPVELGAPGSACGVIALWTRRGPD